MSEIRDMVTGNDRAAPPADQHPHDEIDQQAEVDVQRILRQTGIADERELPTAWRIAVASHDLAVTVAPLNPQSWMDGRFKYWEGPIGVSGSQRGVGYLELTGY